MARLLCDWTAEERAETEARPWGTDYDYTMAQLALRRQMGQKIWAALERMEERDGTARPAWARAAYEATPPWGFYYSAGDTRTPVRRRVYGAVDDGSGTPAVHALTAMLGWNNDVVGGVHCHELRSVDEWNAADKAFFCCNPRPGYFTDPLGFLAIIEDGGQ